MKLRKYFSIVLLSICVENATFSQEGIASNEELDKREQAAMELLSEVTKLSESYGHILAVRDNNLLGENGIQNKYKKCLIEMTQWIQDWTPIFVTVDLKDKIDSNTLQVQVQNMLTRQISGGEGLKLTCGHIQTDVATALATLNNAPIYDEEKLKQHKEILTEMENMRGKLKVTLQNFASTPIPRMEKIDAVIALTKKASLAKLKIELLKNIRIPLEKTIAEFNSILEASKISDASLAKISTYENQMNDYALNLQYYSAKKLLGIVNKECEDKNKELNASTLERKYLKSTIERLNLLCKASADHFEDLKNLSMPPHELVFSYSRLINSSIKIDCNSPKNVVTCNKLSVLNSIKKEKFKDFSEKKLAYIEKEWNKINEDYKDGN